MSYLRETIKLLRQMQHLLPKEKFEREKLQKQLDTKISNLKPEELIEFNKFIQDKTRKRLPK